MLQVDPIAAYEKRVTGTANKQRPFCQGVRSPECDLWQGR